MSIKTPWKRIDDDGNDCLAPTKLGQWVRMTNGPETGVIGPDGTAFKLKMKR